MLLYLKNQYLLISFLSGTHEEVKSGSSAVKTNYFKIYNSRYMQWPCFVVLMCPWLFDRDNPLNKKPFLK